jgi:hypothetical protein
MEDGNQASDDDRPLYKNDQQYRQPNCQRKEVFVQMRSSHFLARLRPEFVVNFWFVAVRRLKGDNISAQGSALGTEQPRPFCQTNPTPRCCCFAF